MTFQDRLVAWESSEERRDSSEPSSLGSDELPQFRNTIRGEMGTIGPHRREQAGLGASGGSLWREFDFGLDNDNDVEVAELDSDHWRTESIVTTEPPESSAEPISSKAPEACSSHQPSKSTSGSILAPLVRSASSARSKLEQIYVERWSRSGDTQTEDSMLFHPLTRRASTRPNFSLSRKDSRSSSSMSSLPRSYSKTGFECDMCIENAQASIEEILREREISRLWRLTTCKATIWTRPGRSSLEIFIVLKVLDAVTTHIGFHRSRSSQHEPNYWEFVDWYRRFLTEFRSRHPEKLAAPTPTVRQVQDAIQEKTNSRAMQLDDDLTGRTLSSGLIRVLSKGPSLHPPQASRRCPVEITSISHD